MASSQQFARALKEQPEVFTIIASESTALFPSRKGDRALERFMPFRRAIARFCRDIDLCARDY